MSVSANVRHSVVSGAPANPSASVDGPAWDAEHVVEITGAAPTENPTFTGTVDIDTGAASHVKIAQYPNSTYNVLTLNGELSNDTMIGWFGGGTLDPSLYSYIPSGGTFWWFIGGTEQPFSISQKGFYSGNTTTISSSISSEYAYNNIVVNDATRSSGGGQVFTSGLYVELNTGGSNINNQKSGGLFRIRNDVASTNSGYDLIALSTEATADHPNGGTAGTPAGTLYGFNPSVYARAGATNYGVMCALEANVTIATGASAAYRWGISIPALGNVRGSVSDAAINISSNSTPWNMGLLFSNLNGGPPVPTTGTLIGTDGNSVTCTNGIDLSSYTITGDLLRGTEIRLGADRSGGGYNAISLNGAMTHSTMLGFSGRSGDPGLYAFVPSGGTYWFFINETNPVAINTTALYVQQTTASTSSSTGALIVSGGAGVAGDVNSAGNISGASLQTTTVAVSALPAAATGNKGMRRMVSDANATTFWSVVAGGGANIVPVTSDGTNWRIG